jgi:hypothetical protein
MTNNPIIHAIATAIVFGVPLLLGAHGLTDITIGTILTGIYHWAGNKIFS